MPLDVIHQYCDNCGKTPAYADKCPFCGRRPGVLVCEGCLRPLVPGQPCSTPACVAHRERVEVTRAFMREVFGEEQSKRGVPVDELLRATIQEMIRLRARLPGA